MAHAGAAQGQPRHTGQPVCDRPLTDGADLLRGVRAGRCPVCARRCCLDPGRWSHVWLGLGLAAGEGLGCLSCIDPKGTGDITGKAVWTFKGIERSISTPAVKDGLVYAADYTGRLFCLDAKTGKEYWKFDTKGHIWASPLVADGKVWIGNEEGELFILPEGKTLDEKAVKTVEFPSPLLSSVVAANGALYITTHTHLYCFKEGAKAAK